MPLVATLLASFAAPAVVGQVLPSASQGTTVHAAAHFPAVPQVSFWKHPRNLNMMRLEEWPDGEMRFWAHQLDPADDLTRRALATRGLEVSVEEMTSEYVLRFCGFGYENGLRYVDVRRRRGDGVFDAIVAVGFDLFRGVKNPEYGDTRWMMTVRRIDQDRLHIEGKLIGWRGVLLFGQVKAEADLLRVPNPPDACTPSPVYAIRQARR